MEQSASVEEAAHIMSAFARDTGVVPNRPARRYLWTDAFAVCNFLALRRLTGDETHADLAAHLVDQVHSVLGRHRPDDARTGWISGLSEEEEGGRHPTRGGLRIGKEMNERGEDEPYDEQLEWDRDGQYYHYLTKWMVALDRAAQALRDTRYLLWAVELARSAHAAFVYDVWPGGEKRMAWKMSIDLTRPLVPFMGAHDPLDGLVTFSELEWDAPRDCERSAWPGLGDEIADLARLCEGMRFATEDPLGIGGLLADAWRAVRLVTLGDVSKEGLALDLLAAARPSLEAYERNPVTRLPAGYRLAFRELGLSLGLRAVERLKDRVAEEGDRFRDGRALLAGVEALERFLPLADTIEAFWLDPENRKAPTWEDHLDINRVMLASSLIPDGYLSA
jgi:hypothetical protein